MRTQVKTLPFPVYFFTALILSLSGVGVSGYLAYSHYRNYTDIAYSSFCAISKSINCDTVSQSPYSIFLDVPWPIWGVIGYLFVVVMIAASRPPQRDRADLWNLVFVVGLAYSLVSIALALVSTFFVQSYCIMCIATYGINFMLVYAAWIVLRRFDSRPFLQRFSGDLGYLKRKPKRFLAISIGFIAVLILIWAGLPRYWQFSLPDDLSDANTGTTESGAPWIGADNPILTIEEFSDYMCFQCKKMHFFLRQLVAQYPDRIRLVHRHFPMDHTYNPLVVEPLHTGSGQMAMIAIYAQAKGQFWGVNDLLFDIASQKKDFNSRIIAQFLDVKKKEVVAALNNRRLRLWLKHEIAVGIDHGVTGTPTFIIDGNRYQGNIPAELLKKIDVERTP